MSELGTRIIAAGLVDDGISVEQLEARVKELETLVASVDPVCPRCECEMTPMNFNGYYDKFSAWSCGCDWFENVEETKGGYA